ncbi:hypothetical protein [Nonomuraea sp. NPDC049400]|uniref:hypothetical protein n=1 Tax=Nonomuraea sp. NPDC049400 TaxID=3364352 RepID=UPI0037A7FEE4
MRIVSIAATAAAGAVIATAVLGGAGTASAATASAPAEHSAAALQLTNGRAVATTSQAVSSKAKWRYVDWYWWRSTCTKAGKAGIKKGKWKKYHCEYMGLMASTTYYLYVKG